MTIVTNRKERNQRPAKFQPLNPHSRDQVGKESGRPSSPTWLRYTRLLILSILAAGLFWTMRQPVWELLSLVGDQDAVSAYLQSFGMWGPLVLALVQLVQILAAVIPGHVFLIAAGYVYGFPAGFLLNIIYIVVASQLAYSLARWAGRPLVNRLVSTEALDRWYKIGDQRGFAFFTIAFLLPVFPTDVMNFVAGLSGITPRKFLAANFLGRLPGALLLTLIGSHGLSWTPQIWLILLFFVAAVYLTGRMLIQRLER